jgi:hypothetical protein
MKMSAEYILSLLEALLIGMGYTVSHSGDHGNGHFYAFSSETAGPATYNDSACTGHYSADSRWLTVAGGRFRIMERLAEGQIATAREMLSKVKRY